ncbi:hypothetical protein [Microbacterium sp. H1-D42]|uniref:DUF6630 family protein n=1 Tax=Microbacterium sp. H1-D42 TaxID=2925844 RepID=UPI001F536ED8|nr:hypothetical protein [Microbacterium sp. H1-D42]UNK69834.1 hypothetical protein MNR00_11720 [Microbacterium sp. H1-D42]
MGADWARLCELLDDDPELGPGVERSLDADPWIALIDGLDDAGALAYLESTDSGVELADALAQLPRVFRAGAELDSVGDVDGELATAIAVADGILSRHDLRIVRLEEDEDACPLVVVPHSHVAEIVALAARCGHGAHLFS